MRMLWRNDVEDGELISDGREETMAVWDNLFGGNEWDMYDIIG